MSQPYPHSHRIRYDAWSVAAAWVLLLLCVVLGLLGTALQAQVWPYFALTFSAFVSAAAVHLVLAFTHQCPVCSKHPTVQGFKPVHPASVKQSKLTSRATEIDET
jgi:hypothetical protein